jgi:hypothetical protein
MRHAFDGYPAPINEFSFSLDAGVLSSELVWSYTTPVGSDALLLSSNILGDVQRLPNGNTLLTYSSGIDPEGSGYRGIFHEVTQAGVLVQSLTREQTVGYSHFRESLYGPPQ